MAHIHEHGHSVHRPSYDRAFAIGIGLNVAFVAVEVVFGLLANSLALVADAGHNLSDVLALALAWGAAMLARRQPTERRTYGWHRSSILAALANAIVLLLVTGGVGWEAIRRLSEPTPVDGWAVIVVAALGTVINAAAALLFFAGRERDLNLQGAFLHLASDAAVSLGVVVSGVALLATGWLWLDPAVSLLVGVVILLGTWGLLRASLNLALDAVPDTVNMAQLRLYLTGLPGVADVHDLHVWGMSTTETALSVHLVMGEPALTDDALLAGVCRELQKRFGIEHCTVQVERGDPAYPCALAPADVV